ncbi:methyl-accepting chemotaxis protein [Candidatus Clostridium radicumherbarum]|uniref:Methyl-accepting chemotaxis protein n=1 Tax=Candidatus Clostridium radicumherbarum TaxID=3381662 RepID=A0ABW8TMZ4_9CLOT
MNKKLVLKETDDVPYFKKLKTKTTFTFLFISVIIIAMLSTSIYFACSNIITKTMAQKAENIAKTAVGYIDIKEFEQLKTKEDEQKDSYIKMRESLSNIRKISGSKFVYTLRKNEDGKFTYVVDGSEESNLSHIGDIDDSSPIYEEVWSGKPYTDAKIRQDQWGTLISSYYPIMDNNQTIGFVGVDYDASDMYAGLKNIKLLSLIFSIAASLIISFCGFLLASYMVKPILKIAKISDKVSKGDLRNAELEFKSDDELGLLAKSFNKMILNMRKMVTEIKDTSEMLLNSSSVLTTSTSEIGISSESINKTVYEIASGSTNQAEESNKGFELVNNLSLKIEEVLKIINTTVSNTNNMKNKNDIGTESLRELDKDFNEYQKSALNVVARIKSLEEASNSIENILKSISSIAEQTNLLALNAAIEAARAGENGKGFAVVSEEVRKLAEQASYSTDEIQKIVDNLTKDIENISLETNSSVPLINRVKLSLDKSQEAFSEIGYTVNNTIEDIRALDGHIKDVDNVRINVLSAVENIASVAQQSAAATQEISASVEEQTSSIDEVITSTKKLDEIIESFDEIIKEYKN